MTVTIGSNISSLKVQRGLGKASSELQGTFERLASGQRINRASDDAAGLAIASALNADSRVFTQALRNVSDGVSILNVAQGGLEALSSVTDRLKELAFQAANGTYSTKQRAALDAEADALTSEYNRIVETTSFNGIKILNGDMRELYLQLGSGIGTTLAAAIGSGLGQFKGLGNIASHLNITTGAGAGSTSIQLADVNRDGKLDMIYGGNSTENAFAIRIGNGDGTFQVETTYAGHFSANSMQLVDFNNDGMLDIVGSGSLGGDVGIALGNGDGSFRYRTIANFGLGGSTNGSGMNGFTIADFNNDGRLDIAGIDNSVTAGSGFSILLGNADGTFSIATTRVGLSINGNAGIRTGDFNGDGRVDLIYNLASGIGNVEIAYGQGDGSFAAGVSLNIGYGESNAVTINDINGDGYDDIVTHGASNALVVTLGNGNGTFKASQSYVTGNGYTSMNLADLNGDGILDYTSVSYSASGRVELRLGNGDGTFKASSTYDIGLATTTSSAIGDVNGDGAVEIFFARNANSITQLSQNKAFASSIETLNLNTRLSALNSLNYIEAASTRISKELSSIGALMSRLAVAGSTIATSREGAKAAESRIMDADVAQETSDLVRRQILQQGASALLGQANQQPALALKLLS